MIKILDFIDKNADWQYKLSCHPYHISTKWDGIYFILKYDQIESDFAKEIVRQCRGSIFKSEMGVYSCVCMPFYKFGNYGKSYVTPLNWNNSYVTEKLDGSLIKLWFDNNEQAMRYARECARKIYQEHEPYDSALVTKEEIREHPTDFGIYPLKEEDFFESDAELEYLHAMDNWLLFGVKF